MWLRCYFLTLAAASYVCLASINDAVAQTTSASEACEDDSHPSTVILGCDQIIFSGTVDQTLLYEAYVNRCLR